MSSSNQPYTDESGNTEDAEHAAMDRVYTAAILTLRIGFLIALTIFVIGTIWSVIERQPLSEHIINLQDLPAAIRGGDPAAVLDLALIVLMLTPVATVLTVGITLFRIGDRRYGTLSMAVLVILLASISLSLIG